MAGGRWAGAPSGSQIAAAGWLPPAWLVRLVHGPGGCRRHIITLVDILIVVGFVGLGGMARIAGVAGRIEVVATLVLTLPGSVSPNYYVCSNCADGFEYGVAGRAGLA